MDEVLSMSRAKDVPLTKRDDSSRQTRDVDRVKEENDLDEMAANVSRNLF